mgnify:FL=1
MVVGAGSDYIAKRCMPSILIAETKGVCSDFQPYSMLLKMITSVCYERGIMKDEGS